MMAMLRIDKIRVFGGQPRRRQRKPMRVDQHLLYVALGGAEDGRASGRVTGHRQPYLELHQDPLC